jgi:hypothetical protein
MTAIGPGVQQSVVTRGLNETFIWTAKSPILPGSLLAQFIRKRELGDFTIECFARENNLEPMQRGAEGGR